MTEQTGIEVLKGIIDIVRDEKTFSARLKQLDDKVATAKDYYDKGYKARDESTEKLREARAAADEMAAKHNDIHQRMEPLIKTTQEMSATLTADKAAQAERERQFSKAVADKTQELDRREKSINVREDRVTRNEADISAREQAVSAREADLAERARRVQQAVA